VVNDGSTDNSADVISGLERRFAHSHRLRVVDKANGGLADARNAGIHVAAGEWILPLDADDMIEPVSVDRLSRAAESLPSVRG
jgi:glycosyltransferase involved in cell wall biosynthesis